MYGMPNKPSPVCLFLCNGGACEKQRKAYAGLQREAQSASLTFASISCQGSCSGPTAVVVGPEGPRWFENLRGKVVRRDLIALADGATNNPNRPQPSASSSESSPVSVGPRPRGASQKQHKFELFSTSLTSLHRRETRPFRNSEISRNIKKFEHAEIRSPHKSS